MEHSQPYLFPHYNRHNGNTSAYYYHSGRGVITQKQRYNEPRLRLGAFARKHVYNIFITNNFFKIYFCLTFTLHNYILIDSKAKELNQQFFKVKITSQVALMSRFKVIVTKIKSSFVCNLNISCQNHGQFKVSRVDGYGEALAKLAQPAA